MIAKDAAFDAWWATEAPRFSSVSGSARLAARLGWDAAKGVNTDDGAWLPGGRNSHWQSYKTTQPELFQIVVTKTKAGTMSLDWLEPVGADEGAWEGVACFSEANGPVEFWMAKDLFELVAPPWAQANLEPLLEEAIIERVRRHRLFTSASEAVLDFPDLDTVPSELDSPSHHDMFASHEVNSSGRRSRCPHGVAVLNHCTKCD
jgi:hypothetical protein